ncbi:histidine kinase [Brachybacterium phenoliresistens]|uniref:histidine kinase n=1 Tax=Brachybacterium phenoliresistens TaxID=396014 RepID=Z9JVX9_9MICO|nr:sensor histidine kinase [Brachybacterium phenoliresistens]EWS82364.1 histidine kinase [Brachybacterium phenoliresistens]
MTSCPPLPRLRDVALALVIGVLVMGSLRWSGRWGPPGPWDGGPMPPGGSDGAPIGAGAFVLAGLAVLAVAIRRWPLPAFALAVLATSSYLLAGFPYGPILLPVVVTSYGLGRHVRLPQAAIAAGAGILLLLAHVLVRSSPVDGLVAVLPGSAWVVVPFSIGLARRLVREASRRQQAEAERRALDAERLRLASEVHDVVGHGLAAIQMHADIALHVRDRRPEQAHVALEAISRASADALAELRATLAAIAPEGEPGDDAAHAPTPGLDRVADLCARMREAGIAVDLEIAGTRRAVPPAVDVAAYRIVQESLTNVVKHASERRADVRVAYADGAIELEVTNALDGAGEVREGFGITGIRRRVRDVGGQVDIGPGAGTFRVRASLPT